MDAHSATAYAALGPRAALLPPREYSMLYHAGQLDGGPDAHSGRHNHNHYAACQQQMDYGPYDPSSGHGYGDSQQHLRFPVDYPGNGYDGSSGNSHGMRAHSGGPRGGSSVHVARQQPSPFFDRVRDTRSNSPVEESPGCRTPPPQPRSATGVSKTGSQQQQQQRLPSSRPYPSPGGIVRKTYSESPSAGATPTLHVNSAGSQGRAPSQESALGYGGNALSHLGPYAPPPLPQQQQQQQHFQETPGGLSASRDAGKGLGFHTAASNTGHSGMGHRHNNTSHFQHSSSGLQGASPSPNTTAQSFSGNGTLLLSGTAGAGGDYETQLFSTEPPLCGLSGVALERQLMSATREELVQTLLELGSCNADAATFIISKASFFSFRRRAESRCGAGSGGSPADGSTARRLLDDTHHTGSSLVTPSSTPARREDSSMNASSVKSDGATADESASLGATQTSAVATPAAAAAGTPAVGESFGDDILSAIPTRSRSGSTPVAAVPAAAAAAAVVAQGRSLPPADRAFAAGLHPCLRWYGSCRNPTSCVFAATPRNLCLNWVRGSCAAAGQCSGVHRLPPVCPPQVATIYALSTGALTRADAMASMAVSYERHRPAVSAVSQDYLFEDREVTATAAPSPVGATTPLEQILRRGDDVPPFGSCESPHHHDHNINHNPGGRLYSDSSAAGHHDDGAEEEGEEAHSDSEGPRTPIGCLLNPRATAADLSSPFRDYFAPPESAAAAAAAAGGGLSAKRRLSAVPRRTRASTTTTATAAVAEPAGVPPALHVHDEVRRCLDDSFARAEGAGMESSDRGRVADGAALLASPARHSDPLNEDEVVDGPIALSAAGEDEYDSAAPDAGAHTRVHTPA